MSQIRRPDLLAADPGEVGAHLRAKGLAEYTIRSVPGDAAYVDVPGATEPEITAALADYLPVAAKGTWQPPREPLPGDLPTHAAHIAQVANATPAQLAALTQAQRDHAMQDIAKALIRLVDARLGEG